MPPHTHSLLVPNIPHQMGHVLQANPHRHVTITQSNEVLIRANSRGRAPGGLGQRVVMRIHQLGTTYAIFPARKLLRASPGRPSPLATTDLFTVSRISPFTER